MDQALALKRAALFHEDPAITQEELHAKLEEWLTTMDAKIDHEIDKIQSDQWVNKQIEQRHRRPAKGASKEQKRSYRLAFKPAHARELQAMADEYLAASTLHFYRRLLLFKAYLLSGKSGLGEIHDVAMRIEFQVRAAWFKRSVFKTAFPLHPDTGTRS